MRLQEDLDAAKEAATTNDDDFNEEEWLAGKADEEFESLEDDAFQVTTFLEFVKIFEAIWYNPNQAFEARLALDKIKQKDRERVAEYTGRFQVEASHRLWCYQTPGLILARPQTQYPEDLSRMAHAHELPSSPSRCGNQVRTAT